ncbi:unnamed protein product [marine sediment metagenome]|uniref:Uncharacterized protein n=1 Tax=marine sediment metagenome TaxID=412755 RepID=X1B7Y1_9ZZZZ
MTERTEEQKVAQAPIVVILGGKEYSIAPLVIRDSREWRQKIVALIAPLPGIVGVNTDDADGFAAALTQLCVTMSDQVIDLFFDYAKDLNQEEIEAVATDAELRDAFKEVMKIAFPLAEAIPAAMEQVVQAPKTTRKKGSR